MLKSEFHYALPAELIAQFPAEPRTTSRLLVLDGTGGTIRDLTFSDLPTLLRPGDLLVFNDTRVIPARVFGTKDTGGQVELLVERVLGNCSLRCSTSASVPDNALPPASMQSSAIPGVVDAQRVRVQLRASKTPKVGQRLVLDGGVSARITGRHGEFFELLFETDEPVLEVLERIGHVPLPPYITRADAVRDRERYQTVYSRTPGAVAAPTAGLHFDAALLTQLDTLGVERAFVTLHVGAGTFQPLRVDDVRAHRMHTEYLRVSQRTAERVNAARAAGRRVVAVGTTVVRALESAARSGAVEPFEGETDIFIYPGYRFQIVDALLTNFHLPESTLLMLVCAFGGTDPVLAAYRHAIAQRYRFFSYGDAMFVIHSGLEASSPKRQA